MTLPYTLVEGNVVNDPELRFTPSGKAVVNFRVAANSKRQVNGQWEDGDSLFLTCSAWEQLAENIAETVKKGMAVLVYGQLKQREFDDKEGVHRTVVEMDAKNVGVSLRYATAEVKRIERSKAPDQAGGKSSDEPPF